ncbi:MAG: ABC transporter ATP-binding protein [Clostridia bacterium]|nr:ABC transporter ATP-binding protein [Clostridia bacterium]
MSDVVIRLDDVSKVYKLYPSVKRRLVGVFIKRVKFKRKRAIDHVSFEVRRGESVALFGKNGAGKSTVLKLITGVAYPTDGTITVDGRVSALLELTSGFDMEFTGRENIYLKGHILGLKDEEIHALEQTIIDFAEIGDYIDQPVRSYSSGMKARLGFSININISPEILIVDEALSVGDAAFRNKCKTKVNEIIEKENVTLLFVTHNAVEAEAFCKRGIVLKNGRIEFDGPIEEAAEFYQNMYSKKVVRKVQPEPPKPAEEQTPAAPAAPAEPAEEKPAVQYYDENGKPVEVERREVYYDDKGNPVALSPYKSVYYDEKGNPVSVTRPEKVFDKDGNPVTETLPDKELEIVYTSTSADIDIE